MEDIQKQFIKEYEKTDKLHGDIVLEGTDKRLYESSKKVLPSMFKTSDLNLPEMVELDEKSNDFNVELDTLD